MNNDLSAARQKFLENEIMLLTLNAGLSTRGKHSKIYRDGLDNAPKEQIRDRIKAELRELAKGYAAKAYSEEAHVGNIQKLADELTSEFREQLHEGRFRIGISQKLLNLYLKYQWTLGWIDEPYH